MAQIQIKNLTFSYDGSHDNIFESTSFTLDTDWRLGFTGRNGRGKTTFLNLLLGKYHYEGQILSDAAFEYFPLPIQSPDDTPWDTLSQYSPDTEYWELARELSLLGVDEEVIYRPFSTLSPGERTKALIAVLFLKRGRFLLIDEPTNHLDAAGRAVLARYLNRKKGFILVSHDRTLLDGCTDHTLFIHRTTIEIQKGNFSSFWENKEKREEFELRENARLRGEIARLKEAVGRTEKWAQAAERAKSGVDTKKSASGLRPDTGYLGHKAAKMMGRAKAIEGRQTKAIEEKSKLLADIEQTDSLKLTALRYHSDPLLSAKELSLYYGQHLVTKGLTFTVNRGERVALSGKNGSGKSSLLKLFLGLSVDFSGEYHTASGLKISYLPQDASFLCGSLFDFAKTSSVDETLFLTILRKLGFPRVQFEKDMSAFSAGQQKKVLLAKSLAEPAHIYLWDEPLNYIDLYSRIQLEELILEYHPTLVFVEHDKAFQTRIMTKELEL